MPSRVRQSESSTTTPLYQVSVLGLVDFVLRTGDLGGAGRIPGKIRAQQGSAAHRKLQKSRPAEYEAEVPLSFSISGGEFALEIAGRIDGVWKREKTLLEEIKSVMGGWDYQPDPLHWAQIKIYGWIYCQQQKLDDIELQLTYFRLDTEQITVFRDQFSALHLNEFADSVTGEYLQWLREHHKWVLRRNASIDALKFPHGNFRPGQRELSKAVYNTILNSGKLFVEAPTGIGKTVSVLFPTVKAFLKRRQDRFFYLTAKNTTQSIAESAVAGMRRAGLQLQCLTLSAKEKVCSINGQGCDALECPFTKGYYDRRKPALREALQNEALTREVVLEIAQRHKVCPHELSLDISEWVDGIICDYNYAFDPRAHLKRHFGESNAANVLLIDEGHNLVDRAREMFSAELCSAQLAEVKPALPKKLNKYFGNLESEFSALAGEPERVLSEIPETLLNTLENLINAAEKLFAETSNSIEPALLEFYFRANAFLQIAGFFNSHYRVIVQNNSEGTSIRLFCVDPSSQIRATLGRAEASVIFSATLSPLDYFRTALGGSSEDTMMKLPSPFPAENFQVLVTEYVNTSFRNRAASLNSVCESILGFTKARRGNYLIFFPSYAYLNDVLTKLELSSDVEFIVQRPGMNEEKREMFLRSFVAQDQKTFVGLAVMGGIFGEGIDLIGDRLIGVAVVGIGLPQICLERNLIRQYFDEQGLNGFEYGYLFPGLNRVCQAAGRLIRSEQDAGTALLLDNRFCQDRVRELLPAWWKLKTCDDERILVKESEQFWAAFTPSE